MIKIKLSLKNLLDTAKDYYGTPNPIVELDYDEQEIQNLKKEYLDRLNSKEGISEKEKQRISCIYCYYGELFQTNNSTDCINCIFDFADCDNPRNKDLYELINKIDIDEKAKFTIILNEFIRILLKTEKRN